MENYLITTERLYLRSFLPQDAEAFYSMNADREVIRYTGDPPFESVQAAEIFIQQYDHYDKYGFGRWALLEKESEQFIGFCGFKYHENNGEIDLGFRLMRQYWGNGLATEAAKASLVFGQQQLKLKRIIGRAETANTGSVRVLEKIGMLFEKAIDFEGKSGVQYAIHYP